MQTSAWKSRIRRSGIGGALIVGGKGEVGGGGEGGEGGEEGEEGGEEGGGA